MTGAWFFEITIVVTVVRKGFEMNHGPQLTQNTEGSTNFPLKQCEEGKEYTHCMRKTKPACI
jgi:hypothetical protein